MHKVDMKRFLRFLLIVLILAGAASLFYFYWERPTEGKNVLTLYGNVDIRQVDLGFRVSGRVQTMLFQEGDFVPVGALMSILDKQPYEDQVRQAEARAQSILASYQNTERLLERRKELVGIGAVAQEDYDDTLSTLRVQEANLKEAHAGIGMAMTNLQDTELYAPADGTILTRIREPGAVVREADPIYTLSLVSPVWVRAYVSEVQLGNIYLGMPAEIYTDTPGGHPYKGHIGFISPVAEFTPKTVETTKLRTDLVYRLRVIADNPDHGLRQGMPVTVKLTLPSPPSEVNQSQESQLSFWSFPFFHKDQS
jgi:HlyD family secretion protein